MPRYRFPDWKGETWNSLTRHQEKYESIKPFLGTNSIGAEIGVDQGGFGEFLSLHCEMLFLVDPWYKRDEVFRSVQQVYENDTNVAVKRQRSIDFMTTFADNFFDFFYIDASHQYDNVLNDISLGFQKLKPGGYLTGDDWTWESVRLAVNNFCKENDIQFLPLPSTQWAIHKPVTYEKEVDMSTFHFPPAAVISYIRQGMAMPSLAERNLSVRPSLIQDVLENPAYTEVCKYVAAKNVTRQGNEILSQIGSKPKTILDIGCGLGLFSLSLYRELSTKPMMFLVDGDLSPQMKYMEYASTFTQNGRDLITNTEVIEDVLISNGVKKENFRLLPPNPAEVSRLPKIDLVVSNYSWFYHYPPEVYWEAVKSVMHENSYMRIDIRLDTQEHPEYIDWMKQRFASITVFGIQENSHNISKTVLGHRPYLG